MEKYLILFLLFISNHSLASEDNIFVQKCGSLERQNDFFQKAILHYSDKFSTSTCSKLLGKVNQLLKESEIFPGARLSDLRGEDYISIGVFDLSFFEGTLLDEIKISNVNDDELITLVPNNYPILKSILIDEERDSYEFLSSIDNSKIQIIANYPYSNLPDYVTGLELIGSEIQDSDYVSIEEQLTDMSPELQNAISKMTQLESLKIERYDMKDVTFLMSLGNLRSVDLSGSILVENIEGLRNLAFLEEFRFECAVDVLVFRSGTEKRICKTPKLKDLSPLSDLIYLNKIEVPLNDIKDISPLHKLVALKYLDISFNKVGDLSLLGYMPNLKSLNTIGNPAKDYLFLSTMNQLSELSIGGSEKYEKVTDQKWNINYCKTVDEVKIDLSFISSNKSIKKLNISNAKIKNEENFYLLSQIEYLELNRTSIKNVDFIKNQSNLIELSLTQNKLKSLPVLEHLKNLVSIYTYGNEIRAIGELPNGIKEVRVLSEKVKNFGFMKWVTGQTTAVELSGNLELNSFAGLENVSCRNSIRIERVGKPKQNEIDCPVNAKCDEIANFCQGWIKEPNVRRYSHIEEVTIGRERSWYRCEGSWKLQTDSM